MASDVTDRPNTTPAAKAGTPFLRLKAISKRFGGVEALKDASLDIRHGEVLAIVGDNGAGKSTLIKTITGVHQPDSGQIEIDGAPVAIQDPRDARAQGIEAIYQDLALVGTFDLVDNFFLGRERTKSYLGGLIQVLDRKSMRADALKVLRERVGIDIANPYSTAFVMSGGQRQAIAIARAIHANARLIIMDEPTAALGVEERGKVLEIIERLQAQGLPVIVISHNLEDVFRVADRIAVMHSGQVAGIHETANTTREAIVGEIMGSRLSA